MKNQSTCGFVWFHHKFYCGNEEDFDAFCQLYENTKLIMSYFASTPKELQNIVDSLNNSNVLSYAQT